MCDVKRYMREGYVVFLNLTRGLLPLGSIAGASAAYYIHEALGGLPSSRSSRWALQLS